MRKSANFLSPLTVLLILLIGLVYFISGCKKSDISPEKLSEITTNPNGKFFDVPGDAPLIIKTISASIKKHDEKKHFLPGFIRLVGYAKWSKAKIFNLEQNSTTGRLSGDQSEGRLIYIPFVKDSQNYVNSILTVRINASDTIYRMLHAKRYKSFGYETSDPTKWNAKDVFHLFSEFDNSVFGHKKFLVKDTNLFKPSFGFKQTMVSFLKSSNGLRQNTTSRLTDSYEVCAGYEVCDIEVAPAYARVSQTLRTTSCSYIDVCTVYTTGGGDGGGDGSGWTGTGDGTGGTGGTGSGTGFYENPCITPSSLRLSTDECSDMGWIPVEEYTSTSYPGKDFNFPFKWWEDEIWLSDPRNFNLDLDPNQNNEYGQLTAAEKALVKIFPREAVIMYGNKSIAEEQTVLKMDVNGLNDRSDAFRHAFFQAINTVSVGQPITKLFSDAHESEVPNQLEKEKQMDLFNNNIGILYGQSISMWTSINTIADALVTKLVNGELRYLNPINFNDPNFSGIGGDEKTATHGIYSSTVLTPTNW
jgi:hypothetical protein